VAARSPKQDGARRFVVDKPIYAQPTLVKDLVFPAPDKREKGVQVAFRVKAHVIAGRFNADRRKQSRAIAQFLLLDVTEFFDLLKAFGGGCHG
jgi:hypothetical protein